MALEAITRQQATFTDHDLARFVHRHTDDKAQFDQALAAVRASPEVVRLGRDGQGRERFSSREMLAVEQRLEVSAEQLGARRGHQVSARAQTGALTQSSRGGLTLSGQQQDAFVHVTGRRDLALVVGYAGTGKSAMLGVAREAWTAEGYRVRGATLSGRAAENLEGGSAIPSRTLASWEHAWAQGRETLGSRDVLVIDEAGLIGSRQMDRVLAQAEAAGAKVVMVGDAEQLQAIEAGAAFRALAERHGAVELTEVRRQQVGWQRDATRHLATERTDLALAAYAEAGMVRAHDSAELARAAVVDGWDGARRAEPTKSQVMLAYTRDDVAALNGLARNRTREDGALGEDRVVQTPRGERMFAAGDRIMFLRNERSLGVKNGTLGRVEAIGDGALAARLDDGRTVSVDLKAYADLDHGYATTIHKSQGVTVDWAHVLASGHMDRHATYVALSRHREGMALHYSRETFADSATLARGLGRERSKDTTLDYVEPFAARRGLQSNRDQVERRGLFAGFRPNRAGALAPAADDVGPMVRAYARAHVDAERMGKLALPILPHQQLALERAAHALDRVRPGLSNAVRHALEAAPALGERAARGDTHDLVRRAEIIRQAGPETAARSPNRANGLDQGRSPSAEPSPGLRNRGPDQGIDR